MTAKTIAQQIAEDCDMEILFERKCRAELLRLDAENKLLREAFQTPASFQLCASPGSMWVECYQSDYDCVRNEPDKYPGIQVRALYTEPVAAKAAGGTNASR